LIFLWQDGAIPGKKFKKPPRTAEEVSQAKQEYEQKRSRSFKLHWTTDRPWLRYNEHTVYVRKLKWCFATAWVFLNKMFNLEYSWAFSWCTTFAASDFSAVGLSAFFWHWHLGHLSNAFGWCQQEYEQKRSRSFKLHWTTDRPWLRYNEHEQMMYCTYCEKQF
jgi:predicted nucleic acid-binding Zn ribbon protein